MGLALITPAICEIRPFAELWNNIAYYDTNIEQKGYASILGRYEGKIGFYLFDTPLQLYGAYYGTASQAPYYWDNAIYYGGGIRFRPFEQFQASSWLNEWLPDLKIFAESLSSYFIKDAASGEANKRNDTRYGLDLWHEWNLDNPDHGKFWGEIWANLSYRNTNFGWEPDGFKDWILYFQPKIGRHLGRGIEVYLKGDVTASGKQGADYYFLNISDYGAGIRFEPWRQTADKDSLLKKFKMFAEVLAVSYLRDKPADPNKMVSSDVRFGIDFSYGR